jgi:hypothetical protein
MSPRRLVISFYHLVNLQTRHNRIIVVRVTSVVSAVVRGLSSSSSSSISPPSGRLTHSRSPSSVLLLPRSFIPVQYPSYPSGPNSPPSVSSHHLYPSTNHLLPLIAFSSCLLVILSLIGQHLAIHISRLPALSSVYVESALEPVSR